MTNELLKPIYIYSDFHSRFVDSFLPHATMDNAFVRIIDVSWNDNINPRHVVKDKRPEALDAYFRWIGQVYKLEEGHLYVQDTEHVLPTETRIEYPTLGYMDMDARAYLRRHPRATGRELDRVIPVYCCRSTQGGRQYRQGMTIRQLDFSHALESVPIQAGTQHLASCRVGYNSHKVIRALLDKQRRTLSEALSLISDRKYLGATITDDYALVVAPHIPYPVIMYKGFAVGTVLNDKKVSLLSQYEPLADELQLTLGVEV